MPNGHKQDMNLGIITPPSEDNNSNHRFSRLRELGFNDGSIPHFAQAESREYASVFDGRSNYAKSERKGGGRW
jgi:hypothetical protein